MEWYWGALFVLSSLFNFRAAFKLLLDWKGMLTTCRFVEDAYEGVESLPDEAALDHAPAAPVFLHLVAAYQEPDITTTVRALLRSRYPHGKLHVVVITKEDEDRAPHPAMEAPTSELVCRFRQELPPYQQKMLTLLVMPGPGRKAQQLNWALRPEHLRLVLGDDYDPGAVYVGVSDADSIPDRNAYRWIAADVLSWGATTGPPSPPRSGRPGTAVALLDTASPGSWGGATGPPGPPVLGGLRYSRGAPRLPSPGGLATRGGSLAYQGVTLSLANFDRLSVKGRVCAVQQSSIFIRVSIARLINEARRVWWFEQLHARAPRLATAVHPVFEFLFRRAQICLGHNQFVRLDLLQSLGGFPTSGATEDSTLGYAIAARGVLMAPMPLLELNDLPETTEGMVRQNARWYKGVLDDVAFLRKICRAHASPFNLAQLCRHVGNKVVEWPIAALAYPAIGFLGWHFAYWYADRPLLLVLGIALPSISLGLSIWVGGIVTQDMIESLTPYCPLRVSTARTTLWAKFSGTFRTQTYWLLATRGAWRVLWSLARTGRFEPAKTDRVIRR